MQAFKATIPYALALASSSGFSAPGLKMIRRGVKSKSLFLIRWWIGKTVCPFPGKSFTARQEYRSGLSEAPMTAAFNLVSVFSVFFLQLMNNIRIRQRCHISQRAALSDIAQKAAHDLAAAGFREVCGKNDL